LLAKSTLNGRRPVRTRDSFNNPTIVAIERLDDGPVVALQTGTHTLVSDGFLTHNSTLYKISKFALARKLAMGTNDWKTYTPAVAQGFIDGFESAYPGVPHYQARAIAYAEERGYSTCLTGFKRPIDEWNAWKVDEETGRRYRLRGSCERKAINTPIQASAGGILKRALVALYERWNAAGALDRVVRIVGQTYDEIIVECDPTVRTAVERDMKELMEGAAPELRVPLVAEGGYGPSWSDAK
jgi:DNA polymerase-1